MTSKRKHAEVMRSASFSQQPDLNCLASVLDLIEYELLATCRLVSKYWYYAAAHKTAWRSRRLGLMTRLQQPAMWGIVECIHGRCRQVFDWERELSEWLRDGFTQFGASE
jgi:hypothetical protein